MVFGPAVAVVADAASAYSACPSMQSESAAKVRTVTGSAVVQTWLDVDSFQREQLAATSRLSALDQHSSRRSGRTTRGMQWRNYCEKADLREKRKTANRSFPSRAGVRQPQLQTEGTNRRRRGAALRTRSADQTRPFAQTDSAWGRAGSRRSPALRKQACESEQERSEGGS